MNQRAVVVPIVGIELGGQTYRAVLNWNARAFFEEETGTSLPQADLAGGGYRIWLPLLHAALQEEHPELSRKDVGKLVGSHNEKYVVEQLVKLFKNHGPDEADIPLAETEATPETASPDGTDLTG